MRFMLITKPRVHRDTEMSLEQVRAKQELLHKMEVSGHLQKAWVKVGGGSVYVLIADNFSELRNAFRESSLSLSSDFEIYRIDDIYLS
jgi:hypothetical protein